MAKGAMALAEMAGIGMMGLFFTSGIALVASGSRNLVLVERIK